jgi:hypothetical protein
MGVPACFLSTQEEQQVVYGVDSLQALILTLQCLEFLFARLRKSGASIRYRGGKEEIDIDLYFRGFSKQTPETNRSLQTTAAMHPPSATSLTANPSSSVGGEPVLQINWLRKLS